MSNRYYRKNNNELKNFNKLDQTVDELNKGWSHIAPFSRLYLVKL